MYSAVSVVVFSLVGVATYYATRRGWTQVYHGKNAYQTLWFW